jgi:hypothetical protein
MALAFKAIRVSNSQTNRSLVIHSCRSHVKSLESHDLICRLSEETVSKHLAYSKLFFCGFKSYIETDKIRKVSMASAFKTDFPTSAPIRGK